MALSLSSNTSMHVYVRLSHVLNVSRIMENSDNFTMVPELPNIPLITSPSCKSMYACCMERRQSSVAQQVLIW